MLRRKVKSRSELSSSDQMKVVQAAGVANRTPAICSDIVFAGLSPPICWADDHMASCACTRQSGENWRSFECRRSSHWILRCQKLSFCSGRGVEPQCEPIHHELPCKRTQEVRLWKWGGGWMDESALVAVCTLSRRKAATKFG